MFKLFKELFSFTELFSFEDEKKQMESEYCPQKFERIELEDESFFLIEPDQKDEFIEHLEEVMVFARLMNYAVYTGYFSAQQDGNGIMYGFNQPNGDYVALYFYTRDSGEVHFAEISWNKNGVFHHEYLRDDKHNNDFIAMMKKVKLVL